MAQPTWIAKGVFASGTGALTVAVPAGYVDNDIFLLLVESANQAIATPAGWTQVANSPQSTGTAAAAGGVRLAVFWKLVTGAQASVSVADTGDHTTAQIHCFRGVNTSTPINVTAGSVSAATTAVTCPSVTTTVGDTLIVLCIGLDKDLNDTDTITTAYTNANLTSITERHDQTVVAGAGGGLALITGGFAALGSTGTTTATADSSTTRAYITLALTPLPVTGSFAATETGSDTLTSSASVLVRGDLAAADSEVDTAALSVQVIVSVLADTVETTHDTGAMTATVLVQSDLAATEPTADSAALSATVLVRGSLAATESGADTASISASVQVQSSLQATEAATPDTASLSAQVIVSLDVDLTELSDSAALTGRVLVSADVDTFEPQFDSFNSSAVSPVSGRLAVTDAQLDTTSIPTKVRVSGYTALTEVGVDTCSVNVDVIVSGSLVVTDVSDSIAIDAHVRVSAVSDLIETEADTAVVDGTVRVQASMSLTESPDTLDGDPYVVSGYVDTGYTYDQPYATVRVQASLAVVETGVDQTSIDVTVVPFPVTDAVKIRRILIKDTAPRVLVLRTEIQCMVKRESIRSIVKDNDIRVLVH